MRARYTIRGDTGRLKVPKQRDFDAFADIRLQIRKFRPRFNVSPTQTVPFVRFQDGTMRLGEGKWGLLIPRLGQGRQDRPFLPQRARRDSSRETGLLVRLQASAVRPARGRVLRMDRKAGVQAALVVREAGPRPVLVRRVVGDVDAGGRLPCGIGDDHHDGRQPVHFRHPHRMPVVLEERDIPAWLDPEAAPESLGRFFRSAPEDYFCRLSIADTMVNSSRNEGEQCIANVSSCPFGPPGQLCVATPMNEPQVFDLPPGLAPGTVVRVLPGEKPGCEVEEVDHPERRHRVVLQLLDPVGKPHGTPNRIWHVAGEDHCDWNQAISERLADIYK